MKRYLLIALSIVTLAAAALVVRARLGTDPVVTSTVHRYPAPEHLLQSVSSGMSRRLVMTGPLPWELEWDVDIPSNAAVRLVTGFIPEQTPEFPSGMHVEVIQRNANGDSVVAEGDWKPNTNHPKRSAWLNRHIELDEPGTDSSIVFRFTPLDPAETDEPTVALAPPQIYSRTRTEARPANVLFITVDTLRADRVEPYRYPRPTSPAIDQLAEQGVLFEQTFSTQGTTWPALTSLMTSLYPTQHGVTHNGYELPKPTLFLAELLYRSGYSTSAFLANMAQAEHPYTETVVGGEDSVVTDAAIEQLERQRDQPFFIWLHLIAPHAAYAPPKGYANQFLDDTSSGPMEFSIPELNELMRQDTEISEATLRRINDLYDAEIAWADSLISQMLDRLTDLDLQDNTLVVFTSDHGEELYQHNRYFFHASSIYDAGLHIPLIMRLPGTLPEGERVNGITSILDVAPTVLDILDLPIPDRFEGRSLLESIPKGRSQRADAVSEMRAKIYSIRTDKFRYVHNPDEFHPPKTLDTTLSIGAQELYFHPKDPREQKNLLAGGESDSEQWEREANRLERELLGQLESIRTSEPEEQEVDESLRKELEALGYIN